MTLIFIGIMALSTLMVNVREISNNWPKYRCRPDVMLMAPLYGKNAIENFEFCLKNGFDNQAASAIAPFYSYLGTFATILTTFLSSINSIRMTFATIVGSITQVFSEFSTRLQALFYRFEMSAMRIKFLMSRVFATMYSLIFAGMSGIKATQNFGNTFLFKFLDTFCFDPDTLVDIQGKGNIPIRDVAIGDYFAGTEDRVTATFRFMADGQTMVTVGSVLVSTNHYLLSEGKWILAKDHPDAVPAADWSGGSDRPLICLNTTSHSFPVGGYIFRDYDETEEGDLETMIGVLDKLNGVVSPDHAANLSTFATTCDMNMKIKLANGLFTPACNLQLGTQLSHGTVISVIHKMSSTVCDISGELFTPGTAIWHASSRSWKRASQIVPPRAISDTVFIAFVVSPSACLETEKGTVFRDYVEIHTPDIEVAYAEALEKHHVSMVQTEC